MSPLRSARPPSEASSCKCVGEGGLQKQADLVHVLRDPGAGIVVADVERDRRDHRDAVAGGGADGARS